MISSPTLLTPQGDGNAEQARFEFMGEDASPTLLTPQGDGNLQLLGIQRHGHLQQSPTLLTPQGDGNSLGTDS